MKEQRTGAPIQVGDVTVTPIAEVSFDTARWRRGLYVRGTIRPVAVVIRRNGHEERVALRGTGTEA